MVINYTKIGDELSRRVSHYSKIIENAEDSIWFDETIETFEWPVARQIEKDEVIDIQLYNYNRYLSNSSMNRFFNFAIKGFERKARPCPQWAPLPHKIYKMGGSELASCVSLIVPFSSSTSSSSSSSSEDENVSEDEDVSTKSIGCSPKSSLMSIPFGSEAWLTVDTNINWSSRKNMPPEEEKITAKFLIVWTIDIISGLVVFDK
ncbi:hypothetical protein KUTeg_016220 [Tegillarca granosa]|uniref:Uncharacterized protein n=1 Tax=Tegillarca granosa TaxID=220873 RepID=A0ABQ9EKF9_TEGGR|nr:hypothetical protein KUTeg_016220 [Tegillarca granosa]